MCASAQASVQKCLVLPKINDYKCARVFCLCVCEWEKRNWWGGEDRKRTTRKTNSNFLCCAKKDTGTFRLPSKPFFIIYNSISRRLMHICTTFISLQYGVIWCGAVRSMEWCWHGRSDVGNTSQNHDTLNAVLIVTQNDYGLDYVNEFGLLQQLFYASVCVAGGENNRYFCSILATFSVIHRLSLTFFFCLFLSANTLNKIENRPNSTHSNRKRKWLVFVFASSFYFLFRYINCGGICGWRFHSNRYGILFILTCWNLAPHQHHYQFCLAIYYICIA